MLNKIAHYLKHETSKQVDKVAFRVDLNLLVEAFQRIGVEKGITVCVHSSLSRLGFVVGGAEAVIDSLIETVGPDGCILMPSFPMAGSMSRYIEEGKIFDVRASSSRVGAVTEVFRRRSDVRRSLHPTHSVAAWGKSAAEFLKNHERSRTPYGAETPYGRLAESENTFILMLGTHLHSLLHHLQERVDFPNLFLPEERETSFIDEVGGKRTLWTKVMRPRIPYFVAIPSARRTAPDWAILHDFALMFPRRREQIVQRLGYSFEGYQKLYKRRAELEEAGVLRTTRVGRGEIGLLHVKGFLSRVESELRDLIERFRSFYEPGQIASLQLPYS